MTDAERNYKENVGRQTRMKSRVHLANEASEAAEAFEAADASEAADAPEAAPASFSAGIKVNK